MAVSSPAHDTADPVRETAAPPRRRVARILVPLAMVLAIIAGTVGTSYWSYRAERAESLRRAEDLIATLQERILVEVESYLGSAAHAARLGRTLLGAPATDPAREADAETFAFGVLRTYPQVAIVSFGDADGDFLMYARQPSGAVDTKRIRRELGTVETTWVRRDASGAVVARERAGDDGYDPRLRPWYTGATPGRDVHWSDVYVFFTSRRPGVTVSAAVAAADGGTAAVQGIDITLDDLGRFLAGLKIGQRGRAAIIDEDGRLVAWPEPGAMLREDATGLRTATVEEIGDPVLRRAWDRFRVEGHGRRVLEVAGERYLSGTGSLSGVTSRPWTVVITVPENDFVGVVQRNHRMRLGLDAAVLAVGVALAALVVVQSVRADRAARRVHERGQALGRQAAAFSGLVAESRLLDRDDRETLDTMARTLAETLAVERVSVWRLADDGDALTCETCFDRRADGLTSGAELHRATLPALLAAIGEGTPMGVVDAAADPRTRNLDAVYLNPLGLEGLLSAPVLHQGRVIGALWAEAGRRPTSWVDEHLPFLVGMANLLALRWGGAGRATEPGDAAPPGAAAGSPRTGTRATSATRLAEAPPAGLRTPVRSATLVAQRAARFADAAAGAADRHPHLSVLEVVLDDASAWADSAGADDATTADTVARAVEAAAESLGVGWVKVAGGRILCAAGFDGPPGPGADALAGVALATQAAAERALASAGHGARFRIGLDTGPAHGAGLGGEPWVYDVWGDAVDGARAMAATAVPGSIQVSEAAYELLRDDHLFAARGRYFTADGGETGTFLLLGKM
ncbi:MAG: GAF domain-containing protein [Ectothiorhodospiraceae bacterium]|nr:GAF domain-containing protein [Ectothiorhodospiraceae bacterium]